jgi:hypothetical protein
MANVSCDGEDAVAIEKEIAMSYSAQPPEQPAEPVRVGLELPAGLARDYRQLVEDGIYPHLETALLHALVESWRHNRGSFHTVRLDLARPEERQAGEGEPASDEPRETADD